MSDIGTDYQAEENSFSDEALGFAEPDSPGPAPEPGEPEGNVAPPDKPRDEQGRFTKTEPEPDTGKIAGEFESVDELVAAYEQQKQRTAELDSLRGQQGSELAELRRLVEERLPPDYDDPPGGYATEDADALSELVAEGRGGEAAAWVLQKQPQLYDRVIREWAELDPIGASRFDAQRMIDERHRMLAQEVAPVLEHTAQEKQTRDFYETWRTVNAKHEDFTQYADQINETLAQLPEVARSTLSPDPQVRERALESLYLVAKAQAGPAPPNAPAVDQAKVQASVANASNTSQAAEGREAQVSAYLDKVLAPGGLTIESGLERPGQ